MFAAQSKGDDDPNRNIQIENVCRPTERACALSAHIIRKDKKKTIGYPKSEKCY